MESADSESRSYSPSWLYMLSTTIDHAALFPQIITVPQITFFLTDFVDNEPVKTSS